jgi:hypothetical protein
MAKKISGSSSDTGKSGKSAKGSVGDVMERLSVRSDRSPQSMPVNRPSPPSGGLQDGIQGGIQGGELEDTPVARPTRRTSVGVPGEGSRKESRRVSFVPDPSFKVG